MVAHLVMAVGTFVMAGTEEEAAYYRLVTLPTPAGVAFEVSGLATLPDGRIAAAIRKGEVWMIDRATGDAQYRRFASGLHEPLGLAYRDGALFCAQRTELTRLRDTDGDGVADEYATIAKGWGVSGNYHEYAYGPQFDRAGNMWLTLNCRIGAKVIDRGAWRGWSLKVAPDGSWTPVSGGLRSPCGLGANAAGDVFCVDHQGNWVPVCSLIHLEPGAFHGHVDALEHSRRPESTFAHPGQITQGLPIPAAARQIAPLRLPAVWFPYRKMGQGLTDIVCDQTGGRFGPFRDQLFVGDFTTAAIFRVDLEKVAGRYQGACFRFREGFQCAVMRMTWGADGSLFAGQTNRGWNSLGTRSYGLQRLVWTGRVPFEVKTMRATPDGFTLTFTQPTDRAAAARTDAYRMTSYTYTYHATYGSPEIDTQELDIRQAHVSADRRRVRLTVDGLREGYVHELHLPGVRSDSGEALLHDAAYYTLNRIPAPKP